MALTLRYVANDILTSLKQKFADADISLSHAVYWTLLYADRLKSQHIAKIDSGAYLHTFPLVPVLTDPVTGRKYIELPETIYDFDLDRGIDYITYDYSVDDCTPVFTSVTFGRTTPSKSKVLYYTSEETPTPENPYFYRVGGRVYLLGIECIDVLFVETGLLSSFDPTTVCDLDAPFDFPPELVSILQRAVLDLGRFVLMMPTERVNDGTDDQEEDVPKTKILTTAQAAAAGATANAE